MEIEKIIKNNIVIAHIVSTKPEIIDVQSALELMMTVKYEANSDIILINKDLICDDFFILSKGVAGEILQKFINYNTRLAIYGDFSYYKSKPLKDFIYESNRGHNIFFLPSKEDAIQKLVNP